MFRLTSNRCRVAETNIRELKRVEFLYFKFSKFLQAKFFLFKVELKNCEIKFRGYIPHLVFTSIFREVWQTSCAIGRNL